MEVWSPLNKGPHPKCPQHQLAHSLPPLPGVPDQAMFQRLDFPAIPIGENRVPQPISPVPPTMSFWYR